MKKTSFVTSMVLMLVFAMIVTACGGKTSSPGTATTTPAADKSKETAGTAKPVKITFMNSKAEIQQQMGDVAQEFTKANPNITVEVLTTAAGQSPVERTSLLYASVYQQHLRC